MQTFARAQFPQLRLKITSPMEIQLEESRPMLEVWSCARKGWGELGGKRQLDLEPCGSGGGK